MRENSLAQSFGDFLVEGGLGNAAWNHQSTIDHFTDFTESCAGPRRDLAFVIMDTVLFAERGVKRYNLHWVAMTLLIGVLPESPRATSSATIHRFPQIS